MIQPLIKICGVQSSEIAAFAADNGVDYIGLNFYADSKRFIDISVAKDIVNTIKEHRVIPVAVFVNHTYSEMLSICETLNIKTIQLHGDQSRQQHYLLPQQMQRIFALPANATIQHTGLDSSRDFLLFDGTNAGSGEPFMWETFHYSGQFNYFVAGGLTPHNVHRAVQMLQPMGVDTASGVEDASGQKNRELIKEFIQAARS